MDRLLLFILRFCTVKTSASLAPFLQKGLLSTAIWFQPVFCTFFRSNYYQVWHMFYSSRCKHIPKYWFSHTYCSATNRQGGLTVEQLKQTMWKWFWIPVASENLSCLVNCIRWNEAQCWSFFPHCTFHSLKCAARLIIHKVLTYFQVVFLRYYGVGASDARFIGMNERYLLFSYENEELHLLKVALGSFGRYEN